MDQLAKSNQFFGINKFPQEWGIVIFPISMSRIANIQSPKSCFQAMEHLTEKVSTNKVGANFIYTEGLYMNFEQNAYETKNNFAKTSVAHMLGLRKLIKKNYMRFQIESAFHFNSWFQMYLSHPDFFGMFKLIKDLYNSDKEFHKYIKIDAEELGKELTEPQVNFYLEEHTLTYLLINMQINLENEFVNGRERWVLLVYPDRPPRGSIYLYQKDPLNINNKTDNPYKGQYDLQTKKFIDYRKVDLTTY